MSDIWTKVWDSATYHGYVIRRKENAGLGIYVWQYYRDERKGRDDYILSLWRAKSYYDDQKQQLIEAIKENDKLRSQLDILYQPIYSKLLELAKEAKKYHDTDPCHYLYEETLEEINGLTHKYGFKFWANLVIGLLKDWNEEGVITEKSTRIFKKLIKNIKKKSES